MKQISLAFIIALFALFGGAAETRSMPTLEMAGLVGYCQPQIQQGTNTFTTPFVAHPAHHAPRLADLLPEATEGDVAAFLGKTAILRTINGERHWFIDGQNADQTPIPGWPTKITYIRTQKKNSTFSLTGEVDLNAAPSK